MNTQTIINVVANQVPAPDYLKLLLEQQKPTHWGFAIQDASDNNNIELAIERVEGCPTVDQLVELCDNAKPYPMLLAFSTLTEPHTNDDIQPFIVNDPDGNAVFTVTIEGDFPHFVDTKSGHGETYNFFKTMIEPGIVQLCEDLGDLDKVNIRLGGDLFNTSFLSHVGHRGVVNILPIMGEPILLGKNELGEVYPWGTVSQRHTFGDVKQEPVKAAEPEAPKKTGWFTKGAGAKTETKVEAVASDPKGQATAGDAPRTTSVPVTKPTVVEKAMKMPEWVHTNQDKKNWYMAVQGTVPENFKKRIPAKIVHEEAVGAKTNFDIQQILTVRRGGKTQTSSGPAPQQTATQQKAAVQTLDKHIEAATLPIIEPKKFEAVLDFVTKHLDTNSQEIANPATIQKMEQDSKIPTFSESLGIDVHDVLNWPPAGVFALFNNHPEAGAMFALEMRNLWRGTLDLSKLVKTPVETAPAVTETKPAEAAPSAKKGWFGKKAA